MKRVDILFADGDLDERLVCALGLVNGKVQRIEGMQSVADDAMGGPIQVNGVKVYHDVEPEKFLDYLHTAYHSTYSWTEPPFEDDDESYDENGIFIDGLPDNAPIVPTLNGKESAPSDSATVSLPKGLKLSNLAEIAPKLTDTSFNHNSRTIHRKSNGQNLAEIAPIVKPKIIAGEVCESLVFALPTGLKLAFCPNGPGGGISNDCGGSGTGNDSGESLTNSVRSEPTTPPPPDSGEATAYRPDVTHDSDGDGVANAARVGVGAFEIPDKIPLLPNLTPEERQVEKEFADMYEHDPEGMVGSFYDQVMKVSAETGQPPIFETDAAKEWFPSWRGDMMSKSERLEFRATMNTPLHQTANVMAKAAFMRYLDTLKPGDELMVTNGGCGAGKGHALKEESGIKAALEMAAKSSGVWDSAGDQNSTENPWIQKEAEARGLKVNYLFVAADPKVRWADEEIGVVARAEKKGRMVDAEVFVDSYVQGAKNFDAFYQSNKDNPNASFHMVDANGRDKPMVDVSEPPNYLKAANRAELLKFAIDEIAKSKASGAIKSGAAAGQRIWKK